jgi:hypothetical protein
LHGGLQLPFGADLDGLSLYCRFVDEYLTEPANKKAIGLTYPLV